MPILFADKSKRFVAAIHCGRKGLEINIIKNILEIFFKKGSSKEDLLVAIGPSISKKYYLLDKKTLQHFYHKASYKREINEYKDSNFLFNLKTFFKLKKEDLTPLNLKKYAYIQLQSLNNISF